MSDLQVATDIAVYAAVLSTVVFIWQIRTKVPRVKVSICLGNVGYIQDLSGPSEQMVIMEAVNTGERPVTLSTVGLYAPPKRILQVPIPLSHVTFPHQLAPLTACSCWTPLSQFRSDMRRMNYSGKVKVRSWYRDQTGKVYKSRRIAIDLEEKPGSRSPNQS